jgi:hypothetical protein
MMPISKRRAAVVGLALCATVLFSPPVSAATQVGKADFTGSVATCPTGTGSGLYESISLSGTAHYTFGDRQDATGTVHRNLTLVLSNVEGVGDTSGEMYRLQSVNVGANRFNVEIVDGEAYAVDFEGNRIFHDVLVRPGDGLQYVFHYSIRILTTADGTQLVFEDRRVECR